MGLDTREWFDGILTVAARQVVKEPAEQQSWIVCDGDIDPEWIESLNSVLDDNRLLTMPSGERIQFASKVNFVFECQDLRFASPATVSRCGMIYMSEDNVDTDRILKSWIERRTYAPQGWTKFYEFSFSDLRSGADIIDMATRGGRKPQWNFLHGLLKNAICGGKVANPHDFTILRTYLEQIFCAEVVGQGGARVRLVPGTRSTVLPNSNHHPSGYTKDRLQCPQAPVVVLLDRQQLPGQCEERH